MLNKHILSAAALAALAAATVLPGSAALAQAQPGTTPAPAGTDLREIEDEAMMVQPFNVSVEDLGDMDIEGADGQDIGEVEEVLMDASGQAVAVSAEVGGFLGIGEKEVVIRLDQLQRQEDHLVTSLTKQQIEALPAWQGD